MYQPDTMIFPSVGTHVLSASIHLLGVTLLAHIISRRATLRGNLTLRDVSWPWTCVLLIFIDSWLFIFSSGILILGVGLEKNELSCSMGIFLCIIFYGSSKLFIYAFLCSSPLPFIRSSLVTEPHVAERVHVVWRPSSHSRRLQCKAYIWCLIVLFGYSGVVAVLFYGRLLRLGGRGYCSQNSRPNLLLWRRPGCMPHRPDAVSQHHTADLRLASNPRSPLIQLLTGRYRFVNLFLTGLFLWPVMRSSFRNTRVKRLAVRTLWSALIALTTSCVNILILTLMHGRQLGWVCLGSCGTDVSSCADRI
jgi:hypothetical protein